MRRQVILATLATAQLVSGTVRALRGGKKMEAVVSSEH